MRGHLSFGHDIALSQAAPSFNIVDKFHNLPLGRWRKRPFDKNGRQVIRGQFLHVEHFHGQKAGIHIEYRIPVADGGYSVVNVSYDPNSSKLLRASWDGR